MERELVDKHQSGELKYSKQVKNFVPEDTPTENIENTPSQAPRKKRIALSGHAITAVSFLNLFFLFLILRTKHQTLLNGMKHQHIFLHLILLHLLISNGMLHLHKHLVAIVGMKRQKNLLETGE